MAVFRELLRKPRYLIYAVQATFLMGILFAFTSSAPYVMINVVGLSATRYGLWIILVAAAYIGGNFVSSRIAEKAGLDRMVISGAALALLAAALFFGAIARDILAPAVIFGLAALSLFAIGLSLPSAQAGAIGAKPDAAGTAAGLTEFLKLTTGAAIMQIAGMLQDDTAHPMALLFLATSILAFLPAVILLFMKARPAVSGSGESG